MNVLDFQELLVSPTKQNVSANTPDNSEQQKSPNPLSLQTVLRFHLAVAGRCEVGTQGHHTLRLFPRPVMLFEMSKIEEEK